MNPRTTAILLAVALALGAFVYFYEIEGEQTRLDAEEHAKQLFSDVEKSDVVWIELHMKDGADARVERSGEKWKLVRPLEFPADLTVGSLAEKLATIKSKSVFEHPQPAAEYGLDDESARIVRFGTEKGEHEVRFGKTTPVGSATYAATGSSDAVYTVETWDSKIFDKSLADLRDKSVMDFDRDAIREITLRWPGGQVVLRKDGEGAAGQWQMTAPVETRADEAAVTELLSGLAFLRARGFVDEPTAEDRALLEPPELEATLVPEGEGAEPLRVAIGRPGEKDERIVDSGRDVLFRVPADRLKDLPHDVVSYRYRTLAKFDLGQAAQINFFFQPPVGDPVAITATRKGGAWSSSPEEFAPGKLRQVASELSHLDADDIVAEEMGEEELETLGLSPPNTIITVLGKPPQAKAEPEGEDAEAASAGASQLAVIHLGRLTPKGVVVRRPGEPTIYRLAPEQAERLPVDLGSFRASFRAEEPPAKEEEPPPSAAAGPADDLPSPREESP